SPVDIAFDRADLVEPDPLRPQKIELALKLPLGIAAAAAAVDFDALGLGAAQEVIDGHAPGLCFGVLERDLEGADHVPRRALQRPVVAKAAQTPDYALDIEAIETDHLGPAEVDDRGEDQWREHREIALAQSLDAVLESDLDHSDGTLRTVREAFLDFGVV